MPTGSFKIRGATWRLSRMNESDRLAGVVAYSTGNHAQAVAKAARDSGSNAIVVMSLDTCPAKIDATKKLGGVVVLTECTSSARKELAEQIAREQARVLVPPYDDDDVIAGQGTIACELVQQWRAHPPRAIFVPIGGGGLIAGVSVAIKHVAPRVKIVGVEPELEDDAYRSLRGGKIVEGSHASESIADAIKVQRVGAITFPLMQRFVDDVVRVSEVEIATAMIRIEREAQLLLEPSGAVAAAAALKSRWRGDIVALASGGNVTMQRFWALQKQFAHLS